MSNNSNPPNGGTGTAELTDAALDAWSDDVSDETEETLEGRDGEEGGEVEAKADGEDADGEEGADADEGEDGGEDEDPEVDLGEGVLVKLSELKQGYQRTADYTRKTQALAAEQKRLEATTALFSQQAQAIEQRKTEIEETFDLTIELLAKRLPAEPDPNLAYSDPQSFMQQKAFYDAGIAEIQRTMQAKEQAKAKLAKASADNDRSMMMIEAQKLENAFPHIRGNPEKREALWKSTYEAAHSLGISAQEMDAVKDARVVIGLAKLAAYQAREKSAPKPQNGGKPTAPIKQGQRPQSTVAPRRMNASQAGKTLRSFRESRSVASAERAWADIDIDKL